MIVVTSDMAKWDWVKWLPHFGDPRRRDAAGNARMVYASVREFAADQGQIVHGRGSFTPRRAVGRDTTPHHVIITNVEQPAMEVRSSASTASTASPSST